tara:strand:- start:1111 stop:1500 length:390 start_codon:yes stop_codon:yes gene_type:complete
MTELSTIEHINKSSGTKLTLVKGQFCTYDAEDSNYIVEVKNRRKYYSTKLIEAKKLYNNFQASQIKGKKFLYVVTDDKGFYVYNISNHMTQIVNLPMKALQCPRSTDFNNNNKITKYSYELPETLAIKL